jgi:hypothetical protein
VLGTVQAGELTGVDLGSDLGDGAASGHQIEHLAAELLGITLGHGHGSFIGRRDRKSNKPTPCNSGHISLRKRRDGSDVDGEP